MLPDRNKNLEVLYMHLRKRGVEIKKKIEIQILNKTYPVMHTLD